MKWLKHCSVLFAVLCLAWAVLSGLRPPQGTYSIDLSGGVPRILTGHLKLGANRSPGGEVLDANSLYFTRNGKPWFPVMGEFHFSRYPREQWEESILKMKAAGIDVIATYVFWIYHEEEEGAWDWTGNRNLREFAELCARHHIYLFARIGPWCHGEVRNGGFPDWLLKKTAVRRNDSTYLSYVDRFFQKINGQLQGLYFKDGGPVIGAQIENEFRFNNPAGLDHILTLKRMARAAGMDVPYYTATGWPGSDTRQRELIPVWGGYPEAPWDKRTTRLPLSENYLFGPLRVDRTIGNDIFGDAPADTTNFSGYQYPYATAEMGGGNQVTYHRRPLIAAPDVVAMAYAKTGSGANLMGYYMFHGGSNGLGKNSTLQESKATRYPNDYPIINYDFFSPLGQWGEVRPSYRGFKTLHLFLNDFGDRLAPTYASFPDQKPSGPDDINTLRWAVRADDQGRGFVFINNYQRQVATTSQKDVQLLMKLKDGNILGLPENEVSIKTGVQAIWPFNFDLGGALLQYATAQPLCKLEGAEPLYVFFAPDGLLPEYVFAHKNIQEIQVTGGTTARRSTTTRVAVTAPGTSCLMRLRLANGSRVRVLTLTHQQAEHCWKGAAWGAQRLFLSDRDLVFSPEGVRLQSTGSPAFSLSVYPAPAKVSFSKGVVKKDANGIFTRYATVLPERKIAVRFYEDERIHRDTALMTIYDTSSLVSMPLYGAELQALPQVRYWRATVPANALQGLSDAFLKVDYRGDTYAAYLDKKLVQDDFYCGLPATLSLRQLAGGPAARELVMLVTPLTDDKQIYFEPGVREPLLHRIAAEIREMSVVPQYEVVVKGN
ncbi:beta-galactosidase [Paraflavisolibacter sp. H34]|uniref:beta-galactosidase n=1 Tax=Huijunlia imazamoxiresistens TaxID=3127457 RepID=UPI00301687C3